MSYCIYVIEDDKNISELLEIALKSYSYEVFLFEKAEDALEHMLSKEPNLIICDIMLPEMDGISCVSKIREMKLLKATPIILLTAKDSEIDKIRGLDAGADDYVTKPFSIMELIARVRAQFRKLENMVINKDKKENILNVGNIRLDNSAREVFVDEGKIMLTFKEFELLKYLIENKNKSISREELLDKIWGYEYLGETRTVDIHIKTLRKKLLSSEHYIKTIRGIGYKISDI